MSIALPIGLVLCVAIPPMTGVSWDDQIHYKNALNLSYVTSPEITNEEQKMSEMAIRLALARTKVSIERCGPLMSGGILSQELMTLNWWTLKMPGYLSSTILISFFLLHPWATYRLQ